MNKGRPIKEQGERFVAEKMIGLLDKSYKLLEIENTINGLEMGYVAHDIPDFVDIPEKLKYAVDFLEGLPEDDPMKRDLDIERIKKIYSLVISGIEEGRIKYKSSAGKMGRIGFIWPGD